MLRRRSTLFYGLICLGLAGYAIVTGHGSVGNRYDPFNPAILIDRARDPRAFGIYMGVCVAASLAFLTSYFFRGLSESDRPPQREARSLEETEDPPQIGEPHKWGSLTTNLLTGVIFLILGGAWFAFHRIAWRGVSMTHFGAHNPSGLWLPLAILVVGAALICVAAVIRKSSN